MPQAYIGRPGRFRSSGRAGGCTSHGRWPRSDPGPCFMGPGRALSTSAQSRSGRSPVTACRVHLLANELSGFPFRPSSLLLIAGRKSWIELLRVLFLDGLVWHRLRVRTPRRSCRRICGADGLINLTGGVRSIRLTGGVYRRGSGRRTYAG
jgi:hypothetical protein